MKLVLVLPVLAVIASAAEISSDIAPRRGLDNSRLVFLNTRKGHVAFIGGSITEMEGYRPLVAETLAKRFPDTTFTFTAAGVASTCSTTGAFRLQTDVLDHGPVDLLFVEFAVNDDQDAAHTRAECIRGMEGMVRQVRRHNPRADVVFIYFVNPGMMETYRRGDVPVPIAAHEAVADHYGLPSVNVCRALTTAVAAGELTWQEFGGVHPGPRGNRFAADLVAALFDRCWSKPLQAGAAPRDYPMPADLLDAFSYVGGHFLDPGQARYAGQWRLGAADWKTIRGSVRSRFAQLPVLASAEPGASLSLEFHGTAVGAYVLAGPDAGAVEVAVDNGPVRTIDLYHRFSAGLHYPRTVMFADCLPAGRHTLSLRISAQHNAQSTGTAVRIMKWAVNAPADMR